MKTPPLLLGAVLMFWGWQTDFLVTGAVMAAVLESARFIKARWELSNEDFSRTWTFCALLFLAAGAYAFTSNDGPANLRGLLESHNIAAQNTMGGASTKTAVLMIRWLPICFFPFIAAQMFSTRELIPLETISLILQRRWKRARLLNQPVPASRYVNVGQPYFLLCLFAASSHPASDSYFFWGLCALTAWAMWPQRARRFGIAAWCGALAAAILIGYGGEQRLVQLQRNLTLYSAQWLASFMHPHFDPFMNRTEIGQLGRIKLSHQILIRLESTNGVAPAYLREAAYRTYKAPVWYSDGADDFNNVAEQPPNSETWPLVMGRTNAASINIACYLEGGGSELPLPESSGLLDELFAYTLKKNSVGAVHAEGPGLVVFNALYGPGETVDAPPKTNEDIAVPNREKPALDQVIGELRLAEQTPKRQIDTVSRFFGTQFGYTLLQRPHKPQSTNETALSWFLLKSRAGHCEYFATATVLLLRELGIPARYTVGYAVHERDGNKFVVRQSDAHAWCRWWNAETRSWEDLDTTPGVWLDADRQEQSPFQFLADGWSWLIFQFSKFRFGQSHIRQYIPWVTAPLLALLLGQILFRRGKRRAGKKLEDGAGKIEWPGLDSEFYKLEAQLARRGFTRRPSETFSEWLRRSAADPELFPLQETLRRILRRHYQYRFDPQGLNAGEREQLREEVAECLERMETASK